MKGKAKQLSISRENYNKIIFLNENELICMNKWIRSIKRYNKDESITGNFIFKVWKDLASRKFKNKFRENLAFFN